MNNKNSYPSKNSWHLLSINNNLSTQNPSTSAIQSCQLYDFGVMAVDTSLQKLSYTYTIAKTEDQIVHYVSWNCDCFTW